MEGCSYAVSEGFSKWFGHAMVVEGEKHEMPFSQLYDVHFWNMHPICGGKGNSAGLVTEMSVSACSVLYRDGLYMYVWITSRCLDTEAFGRN